MLAEIGWPDAITMVVSMVVLIICVTTVVAGLDRRR